METTGKQVDSNCRTAESGASAEGQVKQPQQGAWTSTADEHATAQIAKRSQAHQVSDTSGAEGFAPPMQRSCVSQVSPRLAQESIWYSQCRPAATLAEIPDLAIATRKRRHLLRIYLLGLLCSKSTGRCQPVGRICHLFAGFRGSIFLQDGAILEKTLLAEEL